VRYALQVYHQRLQPVLAAPALRARTRQLVRALAPAASQAHFQVQGPDRALAALRDLLLLPVLARAQFVWLVSILAHLLDRAVAAVRGLLLLQVRARARDALRAFIRVPVQALAAAAPLVRCRPQTRAPA